MPDEIRRIVGIPGHQKTRLLMVERHKRLVAAKTGNAPIKRMVLSQETLRDLINNSRLFDRASNQLRQTFAGVPYCVDPNMKPYEWRFE